MEIYEAVATLRKDKNIKIEEAIGNSMSRASFNRYINGKTDLYTSHFLELLEKLHVSLEEIEFMCNGYTDNVEKQLMKELKHAFEDQNIHELNFILQHCRNEYALDKNVLYSHLASLTEVLLARLEHKNIDLKENELYKYLVKTETWTRYELVMFNNSMFYFDAEALKQILPKAINKLAYYKEINPYANEGFRLLINAIIAFISKNEIHQALIYIRILEKHPLNEDQAYEALLQKFLIGVKLILIDDSKGDEVVKDCIQTMQFLNMEKMASMSTGLIEHILENKQKNQPQ